MTTFLSLAICFLLMLTPGCESSRNKVPGQNAIAIEQDTLQDVKWAYYSFIYNLNATALKRNGERVITKPVSCGLRFIRKFVSENGYENFVFMIKPPDNDSLPFNISPLAINGVSRINRHIYIPLYHMADLSKVEDTLVAAKEMLVADSLFRIYVKENKHILSEFLTEAAKVKGLF